MSEYGLRQQDYETIKALKQELADLRARLENAEKDAERYRMFLKVYDTEEFTSVEWGGQQAISDYLDAAIAKERTC